MRPSRFPRRLDRGGGLGGEGVVDVEVLAITQRDEVLLQLPDVDSTPCSRVRHAGTSPISATTGSSSAVHSTVPRSTAALTPSTLVRIADDASPLPSSPLTPSAPPSPAGVAACGPEPPSPASPAAPGSAVDGDDVPSPPERGRVVGVVPEVGVVVGVDVVVDVVVGVVDVVLDDDEVLDDELVGEHGLVVDVVLDVLLVLD